MAPRKQDPMTRFMQYVIPEPNTGCWLWFGNSGDGRYGRFCWGRVEGSEVAHKALWRMLRGPVPEGKVLDHICKTTFCVNPDHLRPVTQWQNIMENSNGIAVRNAAKPCCPKCGEPYTQHPTRLRKRWCKPCYRANQQRYYKNQRGA